MQFYEILRDRTYFVKDVTHMAIIQHAWLIFGVNIIALKESQLNYYIRFK